MPRYSVFDAHNSAQFYRHDVMEWRRRLLGISIAELARRTHIREETVRQALLGNATNKKAYLVCAALGLDWAQVHNLELQKSDFHLAILNSESGESRLAG